MVEGVQKDAVRDLIPDAVKLHKASSGFGERHPPQIVGVQSAARHSTCRAQKGLGPEARTAIIQRLYRQVKQPLRRRKREAFKIPEPPCGTEPTRQRAHDLRDTWHVVYRRQDEAGEALPERLTQDTQPGVASDRFGDVRIAAELALQGRQVAVRIEVVSCELPEMIPVGVAPHVQASAFDAHRNQRAVEHRHVPPVHAPPEKRLAHR